jgi:membrane protein implicated in regulation of membrane protease activity
MTLEFISGFLLLLVVLGALAYIVLVLLSGAKVDLSRMVRSDALGRQRDTEPVSINDHLIGMPGEVVRLNDDSERPMTIRVGIELWPARMEAAEANGADSVVPSIGGQVLVTAVQGSVIVARPAEGPEGPGSKAK